MLAYCGVFYAQQQRLPGGFEVTSTVNNTMPLVLAGMAQTLVVLTRGIDLSVGGIIDLTNATAAITLGGSPGSMVLWSVIVLLIGAACGLVNGLLVGIGRLQPILVTLATLSIYQGVAIRVLPQPGGQVPRRLYRGARQHRRPVVAGLCRAAGRRLDDVPANPAGRFGVRDRQRPAGGAGQRHRRRVGR